MSDRANRDNFNLGIVMNPLRSIKPYKDSTLALMLAAQEVGANLFYMEPDDLFVKKGEGGFQAYGLMTDVCVFDNEEKWFESGERRAAPLRDLDAILMRADPPVDTRFIHTCHMLEQAAREGVAVYNDPTALITLNEKLFATHFPDLCPPTIIASDHAALTGFLREHKRIVIKPLDGMGGDGVFMVHEGDVNFDVIWEIQTRRGQYPVIAQAFIPEITEGDRRVLVIHGEVYAHMLVRTPKSGSMRGNIAAGGTTHVAPVSAAERKIAEQVAPVLKARGIIFAGLDVIGGKLIEINITSPTGLRQIARESGDDPARHIMSPILS